MASDSAKEFAPLVPLSNLSQFLWARYSFANEQICHGNAEDAVETFYDLLLEPELPIYLRSMVNCSLALIATHRTLADRARWLNEARRNYEVIKRLKETINSEKENAFLEDTIRDAEKELQEVRASPDAQELETEDDGLDDDEDEGEVSEEGQRGEDDEDESFQDAIESLPNEK